ncbi:ferredoxin domain-containing protein [[Eubacterium] cellulosolvens]
MPIIDNLQSETQGLLDVAKLMMVSARTAPKSGGKDDIETMVIYGEDKDKIAAEMNKIGEERNSKGFLRDGKNVKDSEAIILVGVEGTKNFGLDCGGCGFKTCTEFNEFTRSQDVDFTGPNCIFKILDMGIALGSAAKTAMDHNVDNRIMYRIGPAAIRLGLTKKSSIVMGIPISAKGKSIYFDR